MSKRNLTKTTFYDRIMPLQKPTKKTLFGWDIDFEFMPEDLKVVTAGDIVNKNFPSEASSNRVFWSAPEWFPADIGAKRIRTRLGVPDVNPKLPVYTHTNPMFVASDRISGGNRLKRI